MPCRPLHSTYPDAIKQAMSWARKLQKPAERWHMHAANSTGLQKGDLHLAAVWMAWKSTGKRCPAERALQQHLYICKLQARIHDGGPFIVLGGDDRSSCSWPSTGQTRACLWNGKSLRIAISTSVRAMQISLCCKTRCRVLVVVW